MRKLITSLLLITAVSISAQTQKGLLWKISGNGLKKPSYVYGNMHVSEKIAFHLGEEFFDAIQSVDAVALESNPIIWLDEIMNTNLAYSYIGRYQISKESMNRFSNGFYKRAFKISIPDNNSLAKALMRDHYFMNWLLYREDKSQSDFEEETFLDMFIYQAGAKNGKPVLSLENFKKTTKYFELSNIPDKEKKEPSKWYKKLIREKGYTQVMEEAYRKQDLSLIDSLQKESNSNNALYWMIYKRNEIMANNIDSIIKTGTTLFSGIGAAHLPGEKGVLKLLENKGYTLTPMPVTFSDKARKLREEFDKKKLPLTNFKKYDTDMFSVECPVKIYETPFSKTQRQFFAADLTNGTHYSIKQISTFGAIKGLDANDYYIKIDSLLFENIPGKIVNKTKFTGDFYKGIDILNKTKSGDYQRYRIYVTPIEIIIFKMGGKDEYAKKYGDGFFKSIKLKKPTAQWKSIRPVHNDFAVDVPGYYSINFNKKVTSLYGNPVVEAWDIKDSSYYFIERNELYDFDFIEQDAFEAKRIAEQFFLKHKLDTVQAHFIAMEKYPAAIASGYTKDSSRITVKVIINGPYYYLLAGVSKHEPAERFFDSFKIQSFDYKFDFREKTDSGLFFTVNSNYLLPRQIDYTIRKAYREKREKNKTENTDYRKNKKTNFYASEAHELVYVSATKFHDYKAYDNIDSLWKDIEDKAVKNNRLRSSYYFYSNLKKHDNLILKQKRDTTENGLQVLYLTLTDTASSRAYLEKYILKKGMLYRIISVSDTAGRLTKFAAGFFKTLKPSDTLIGRSPFEDKAALFFKSIYGNDSLARINAFKSVDMINFKKKDADSLMLAIKGYKFPAKYMNVKKELIDALIGLDDDKYIAFAKELYKKSGDTSMYQIQILRSLAEKGSKNAIKTYLELLDYDIPISGSKYSSGNSGIYGPLIWGLKKNKEKTKVFPELLNYTFIHQYRAGIIKTLALMVDSNYINPKIYKKHKEQLLREAKIELKKQISFEQSKQTNQSRYNKNEYKYEYNNVLVNYAAVLMPFYKDKKVAGFLDKFARLKNYTIRDEVYCRMQKRGIKVDAAVFAELARDPINVSMLYSTMKDWKILDKFPQQYINQKIIARSLLFTDEDIDFDEDSVLFVDKRFVSDGKDSGWVYFFKSKEKGEDDWELNYSGYQPMDSTKVSLDGKVMETTEYIDKSKDIKEIIDEKVRVIELRHHPHADGEEERSYRFFM